MKKNTQHDEWQAERGLKTHAHNIQRSSLKKARRRAIALRTDLRRKFGRKSEINKKIARFSSSELRLDRRGQIKVVVPQTFSIIESPEDVLSLVGEFAKAAISPKRIRNIFFDHFNLKKYDLAANALLDIVATELDNQYTIRGSRLSLKSKGALPADLAVRRFIRAIGIIKHLDVKHEAPNKKEASVLEVFDARKKHYSPEALGSNAGKRDLTARKFVDHINKCLGKNGRELTASGLTRLAEYLTEILNNAEEHAGFIDWTLQGYLDGNISAPVCEIAIFNFGDSIAETLDKLPRASYTWDQIGQYITMHAGKQYFGPNWREQDLLTVVALQPHVSSKNQNVTDTRGQGTVDLIQFFQKVHEECTESASGATMAIVSGGTYIRFDGSHKIAAGPNGGRPGIAFNDDNDLHERPNPSYVRPLGNMHFPGTIISIKFPLSSADLIEEKHSE